ncbi:MAG: NAD(P)-binding domain-containing protein [Chitinophagaceae bacterium]|nr:NAD(P)-binding domain-containing protein [Chitinophagaceae bacterium]
MRFGIIGSGSWATALAKILTDNGQTIEWGVRSEKIVQHLYQRNHNPHYLSSVYFNKENIRLHVDPKNVLANADCIVIAVPSAYAIDTLKGLSAADFKEKKITSAIKGILPSNNLLLNEYLDKEFGVAIDDYFTVMGPCHAEEVAAEKLSYLTFSGTDIKTAREIASHFTTEYMNTVVNNDVTGVQFAAILKNIYALGAGIAHGLEYGDNFLSVLIANCADEMAGFLQKTGIPHMEVGVHESEDEVNHKKSPNYAASVYLGDLLVTCYSLFSRNRTFGNMIGKGYSVSSAKLEMNMVAEGYTASKCINSINKKINADIPIADAIYSVLWENVQPAQAFRTIEELLV